MSRLSVAARMTPVVRALLGGEPGVTIRFWDGSTMGPGAGPAIEVRSPAAVRRLLWAPGELGLARAYVAGDIDIDGPIYAVLDLRALMADPHAGVSLDFGARGFLEIVRAAVELGALGLPPQAPAEEIRLGGRLHTRTRDARAVTHHYDVSNDFYRLVLGPTLTYSCAYWNEDVSTLEDAQTAKYEHICRKLGLQQGMRLLDVGCGWGGMVLHAAREHGVEALGITLSRAQHQLATRRVEEAGLTGKVEIRIQDYRDMRGERFDAISSIGMFEHVGEARLREYATILRGMLGPEGRLLNHGISRPPGPAPLKRRSFINRYVFPDGELHEVGRVVSVLQEAGLEVRDVESLREHYAKTLRAWVANLEANWDQAVELVGAPRARVWRLYMAGSARNFEEGRTMIHQVLGVRTSPAGASGMPASRRNWYKTPAVVDLRAPQSGGSGGSEGNGGSKVLVGDGGGAAGEKS